MPIFDTPILENNKTNEYPNLLMRPLFIYFIVKMHSKEIEFFQKIRFLSHFHDLVVIVPIMNIYLNEYNDE